MSLHVTHVVTTSLAVPEPSRRRVAAGGAAAAHSAAKESSATRAVASFDSLMASSSAVDRSATQVASGSEKRAAAAAAIAASSKVAATTGTTTPATATTVSTQTDSPATTQPAVPPTAQSVFGPDVWMTNPTGLNPDGTDFQYNPIYFATPSTAQTVAQMVGGTVVIDDQFCAPGTGAFPQNQPNYMVKMPNGAVINPGLVASFYTFGFSQSQVDTMVAQEAADTPPPVQKA